MLHQDSGSRPSDKSMQELGSSAHRKREVKVIPRKMAKQNPWMTAVHQPAQIGAGQKKFPQEDEIDWWNIHPCVWADF